MVQKKNPKKDALENGPKEAEAKKKAEGVLPVGSAVVEDEGDDDEEQEEAEDDAPPAPGPDARPAILPDARSTTTAAKKPEHELRADWLKLVENAAKAEADVERWGGIINDPLFAGHLARLNAEVNEMKEEMTKADGTKELVRLQADVRARRWVVAKFSPTLYDADRNAARAALERFRAEPWHRGPVQKWEAELGWSESSRPTPDEVALEIKAHASVHPPVEPAKPATEAEKVAALKDVAAKGEKTKAELAGATT